MRETFEQNHRQLDVQYDGQGDQLKVDLEIRRQVEIHEIEERKNQHNTDLRY